MYILPSVSSGLEFLSINHTEIHKNSDIKVELMKYLKIDPMIY